MKRSRKFLVGGLVGIGLISLLVIILNVVFLDFVVETLWYQSLGYLDLMIRKIGLKYMVFAMVSGVFFLLFFLNFWVASRYLGVTMFKKEDRVRKIVKGFRSGSLKVYTPVSLLLAVLMAFPLFRAWEDVLLYYFAPNTGNADAQFGLDVSFYLFGLPVVQMVQGRLFWTLILLLVALGVLYAAELRVLSLNGRSLYKGARLHIAFVLFLILGVHLTSYGIEALMLQYTDVNMPLFYGPGYAEIVWGLPLLGIAAGTMILLYVSMVYWIFRPKRVMGIIFFAILAFVSHISRDFDPLIKSVNSFRVEPNEQTLQADYIEQTIDSTLTAYGLTQVERRQFEVQSSEDWVLELKDSVQLESIPLWDPELLEDVFQQLQAIRPYYEFNGVDAARYQVKDRLHQVYLAGREITTDRLPEGAQSWVNLKLKYTHGYGLVMTPAAQRAEAAMQWYIHNMPPESKVDFEVNNPSIYYGLGQQDYVIAPNESSEFHHPGLGGGGEVEIDYTGKGGVSIGSFLRKSLFALYFKDRNLFFTTQTLPESRLHFRRNIVDRIERITPFLQLDDNPYLVVTPDRLYWMVDAYTTSKWYPNSQAYEGELNYIRNSVKITVDAYDGTVEYYLADPTDPIALAYQAMYPDLIHPITDMPEGVRSQIRYPRDLFEIQMQIFAKYHQEDPNTFYKDEDLLEFPKINRSDSLIKMRPYYITTDLVEEGKEEFLLLAPFLPVGLDNLRALAVVSSEPERYGEMTLYTFPKGSLVYGPPQVNALIDQNTDIAQSLTLWNQQGSEVKRGKMIVLPINGRVFYIQPLYLEATGQPRIPQLKRVIVSVEGHVVMDTSIESALKRLHEQVTDTPSVPGTD
mgnify:CR=1 FL=1